MTVSQQESPHELFRAAFAPRPELDATDRARLRRIVVGTDALAVLAGAWVLCAPLVLGFTTADRGPAAFWNAVLIGMAIAVAALVRAGRPFGASPVRVAGLMLGGWLAVAPRHSFLPSVIADELGAELPADTTLLYGGSVTAANADGYFTQPDIDGGLVGGASQDLTSFRALIEATITTYQRAQPAGGHRCRG